MANNEVNLFWHKYKFFPYEKKLAIREIQTLLVPERIDEYPERVTVTAPQNRNNLEKLVYFSHTQTNGALIETEQFQYENGARANIRLKKQNTRYSAHGLHEYKGKFNPQVVRSLYNIFGIQEGSLVLDPFCGSGTSLVEAAHQNIRAVGTDINPLAAFIANTKLNSLQINIAELREAKEQLFRNYTTIREGYELPEHDVRLTYLNDWFPYNILLDIEAFRLSTNDLPEAQRNVFLVIASNLLRDYSLQEPGDLRIRRRRTPLPETPFKEALLTAVEGSIVNLESFQVQFGVLETENHALNLDIRNAIPNENIRGGFDFAITSPPYATALPYIDTQRLSLVWLDMISAREIKNLESDLIGSREFKLKAEEKAWSENLATNTLDLPEEIYNFCFRLYSMLTPTDGFRKKALPSLLYRYFKDMSLAFTSVHNLLNDGGHFALIVGHNHTKIGGVRTDIDTPYFLGILGESLGFQIHEITPLEAYQRYGLNASNAVEKESLIVFTK
ncbi:TRM11 family SAM-dependent methyltransferase [Pontibacter fetidus]|uniref:DNA methylase n=1 Tax=Pontibacter fetidus TaxID=2700082 RepID=A0A6B2GXS3_9BACT|nr:DNA methyltransferase [Pontibacter fetidus]NDK54783.1 DNA methylase [Pontibacter fetidus]